MSVSTSELYPQNNHKDGFFSKITIETGVRGLGRLNVASIKTDGDEVDSSQGADLTASECRALAQMLLATACLVDAGLTKQKGVPLSD